jgi:hypothetical protein
MNKLHISAEDPQNHVPADCAYVTITRAHFLGRGGGLSGLLLWDIGRKHAANV